jgi:hypothetical protein
MKHISRRQDGMTALGIFLLLGVLACFVLFGLTVFPLYNEYLSVKSSMESTVNLPPAKRKTTKDIQKYFLRNVEINGLDRFTDYNIKEMVFVKKSKDGKQKFLNVKYQATNKLFKNIFLMMDVDETMELTGSAPQ